MESKLNTSPLTTHTGPSPHATSPPHLHTETHASHSTLIHTFVLGFSDGLTVPFALTASLTSLNSSRLVILAGLAELFSGAISMGLGAYLAAVTDAAHYRVEEARERREVRDAPADEQEEIFEVFAAYGVLRSEAVGVVGALMRDEEMWVKFMMDFELRLPEPKRSGAWIEGLVMGLAYFIGGLLPMIPYFAFSNITHALFTSIGITVLILIVFGYGKAMVTGTTHRDAFFSAMHTLSVGVIAAGTSYGIVKALDSSSTLGNR